MKDAGLRIRVEPELRSAFTAACRREGNTAAQVLREFMRRYVTESVQRQQVELPLFETDSQNRGQM